MRLRLTDDELERVRLAIVEAERGSSGEVVPFVVAQSDDYEVVLWRSAALSGACFFLLILLVYLFYEGWALAWMYTGIGMAVWVTLGFTLGALVATVSDRFFRFVAGRRLLERRVRARAERAFFQEGVFRTVERTGILIFVSLREHRIEVVADEGISARVPKEAWLEVVSRTRLELRQGGLADGLVAGVAACGQVLSRSGLSARDDDENELRDELRMESE